MHFLNKTMGFMAVFCVIPGAFALTSRVGVISSSSARMPTLSQTVSSSSSSSSTTSSTLLANAECIEAYTGCMKEADACGPNFEECTTKVLFHGKMPQCLGTLAQCSSAGVNSLFGTSNVSSLSAVASTNSYGEVTNYTYPTDGSVLGQLIIGAEIANRYDTSTCVRRYTSCLKKDSVCGNDFELCTTSSEFRKQRVFCDSTLARCQSEGLIELFGSASTNATPTASSRIGTLISEGAALAAVNAVSTCYKVIDQCILGACAANPYKCYDQATQTSVKLVDAITTGGDISTVSDGVIDNMMLVNPIKIAELVTPSSISGYIKSMCLGTIGSNKYCYATFLGNGQMPTASQLKDEDNQEEIYDEAYSSRMNSAMKAKIVELVNQFDTKAKTKCVDTIKSCAMRVCGSGSGAACYSDVFGKGVKSINKSGTWAEIKTGCAAVVNTDLYCKYAAENPNATGTYNYTFNNGDAFDKLFPEYEDGGNDPIGAIATLNSLLATSYSDAAIAQMRKQCQAVATSCVRTLCGENYAACYRNRTDVYSSLTKTDSDAFDRSMNKVGGVLDYTIVLGLCLDTVKNASVCEEHLAIETSKYKKKDGSTPSWGDKGSVREGWIDAGAATHVDEKIDKVDLYDENGNPICDCPDGSQAVCYSLDSNNKVCESQATQSYLTFVQSQAASSLFKDLIYDLEKEAQAKYNAALTREQSACIAANNGGIMGNRDSGSTYMWVKLKSSKVPANYAVNGLKENQFATSNDLYGSFCRVKVEIRSDDKKIQEAMRNASWTKAYFATGDVFTCGSWIPESALTEIADAVADDATKDMAASQKRVRTWTTILGALGGSAGGVALGESIRKGNILGGLTGLSEDSKIDTIKKGRSYCKTQAQHAVDLIGGYKCLGNSTACKKDNEKVEYAAEEAIKGAKQAKIDTKTAEDALRQWKFTEVKQTVDQTTNPPTTNMSAGYTALGLAMNGLVTDCGGEDTTISADKLKSNNGWITGVSTVVTGTAGALLLNKATRDIQQSNLDAAQKAAYEEWMNAVGRHITCYVGDEEIEYGAVASITLD